MSHISFQERGQAFEYEADYVVVGSGPGGATMASALARGGAKVCLVEAGPWRDPEHYPHRTLGALRDLFDDGGNTFAQGRAMWPVVQASAMGGTSIINSAICVRTPADVFEQWSREHGLDIGLRERFWRHQDALESELHVSDVPPAALGNSNRLAMKGATAMGYDSHFLRRYVKDCAGSGQCLQGCSKGRKQSMNITFVPEVLQHGGRVLSCAPVRRVRFEGRRAVAVTGHFRHPSTRRRGADFTVRARRAVVVAASATHSPCLLQRSGVRSKALGKGFRAHPGAGVFGVYDQEVDSNIGATQGWASTAYRESKGIKLETLSLTLGMSAGRLPGGGSALMKVLSEYRHVAMWVQATRARTAGTVHNGWFDKPSVRYSLDRRDMQTFRHGLWLVARTHIAAGAVKVLPCIHGFPAELGADEVDKILEAPLDNRAHVGILSHLFGGCVAGADPATSVTDSQGRVHGYQGLVVSDASTIPTTLGINPQHTIMAWSRDKAEALLNAE